MGNAESFMQFDVTERLGEISCPALVLHGTHDIVTPLDPCAYSLRDGLPNASLEIFEGVNHCPMTEDPQKTNRLMRQFLEHRVID
jgi:pimeloyl-ACP methyl ester carboxylesterase